jgi:hypothetical protein
MTADGLATVESGAAGQGTVNQLSSGISCDFDLFQFLSRCLCVAEFLALAVVVHC